MTDVGSVSRELLRQLEERALAAPRETTCPRCGSATLGGSCPACEAEELRGAVRAARLGDFEGWLSACAVPRRYRDVAADWPMPAGLRDWHGDPWSLTVLGLVGTGKTSLATAVLGRVAAELGDGLFISAPELIRGVLADIRGHGRRIADKAIGTEVLLLDDLGSERAGEFAAAEVSSILCARYDSVKPTIVTSNLNLDDLEPRIGSRLASGVVLRLEGGDRRISKMPR